MAIDAEQLRQQIRQLVRALRQGSREKWLSLLAPLLFAVAGGGYTWLPASLGWIKIAVTLGATILGGVAVLSLVWTIWKQALPSEPPPTVSPSAIKGPTAFGPQDGELFLKLGRTEELRKLLSHVLDDQIPGVIVMGESGAGKTSLLRAGLTQVLKPQTVRVLYWEAQRRGAVQSFLNALHLSVPGAGGPPLTAEAVCERLLAEGGQSVLVLDQFEQLDPHNPDHALLFDFLQRMFSAPAPHPIKTIVAFRSESASTWFDFEAARLDDLIRVPRLSVRTFSEAQATNVMAALAEFAGFTLDDDLVQDFLGAIRSAERQGVSPVEIGIGMLVLSELAVRTGKTHLRMTDYRFGGGSLGILTEYLRDRLERFGEGVRPRLIKALLSLVDLERNQRIAEGRTVLDLAETSGIDANRLRTALDHLVSAQVRLLEVVESVSGAGQRYRLPHERLIPALRRLGGQLLVEVDQVRLRYEAQLRGWNLNDRNPKYLLSGKDLRLYLKHRNQIPPGTDRDLEEVYLRQSKARRNWHRVGWAASGVLVLVGGFLGWQTYQDNLLRNDLEAWQLPVDLVAFVQRSQVKTLRVNGPFPNLPWLKSRSAIPRLTTLDLSGSQLLTSLAGLEKLPNLTTLNLRGTKLTSLAGLEKLPRLTTLDLSGSQLLPNLAGLEKLPNLAELEKLPRLTTLDLGYTKLTSLAGLEKLPNLTTLNLRGTKLTSLAGLEKLPRLTTLDLSMNPLPSLAGLEKLPNLTTLNLHGTKLTSLAELEKLPRLTTLDLSGSQLLPNLVGLEKLPNLTTLDLSRAQLTSLDGLEKLPNLTTLDLSMNPLPNLAGLEKLPNLTTLDLSQTDLTSLDGLEKLPNLTTLNLSGTKLTSLAELEKLPRLTTLNLAAIPLPNLAGLEKLARLKNMILFNVQLQNLRGLPPSVEEMVLGTWYAEGSE